MILSLKLNPSIHQLCMVSPHRPIVLSPLRPFSSIVLSASNETKLTRVPLTLEARATRNAMAPVSGRDCRVGHANVLGPR